MHIGFVEDYFIKNIPIIKYGNIIN